MKVYLAGYNVDAEVLKELTEGQNRRDVTPETLSAAYARISRDPRPINELRQISRAEVEKARSSNSNIIFKMGHHSIAEHAVFNFDILDVSRLALEEIEKFRLCSYTEKSQRYQKLEGNCLVPEEISASKAETSYLDVIGEQNAFYAEMVGAGVEPEDARYITSLSTCGQVGMTINARNLELLFRRFASNQLAEVRELGRAMFKLVEKIAPSIILFTEANDFDQKTYQELRKGVVGRWRRKRIISQACDLIDYTEKADLKLVSSLLHTSTGLSFRNCRRLAKKLIRPEREALVKQACRFMEFYDSPLREYEHVALTYDLVLSSACFAQLKRHRLATITAQLYQPELGVTVPPKIRGTQHERRFKEVIKGTDLLYAELAKTDLVAAQYVLTGAHRKRVLMTLNARELYHLSRLREDRHAQWDINDLSAIMTAEALKVMPLTMNLIGGKDRYQELYKKVYGRPPRVLPPGEVK